MQIPWNDQTDKTALWFLGQAGYFMKSGDRTVIIDPYLSDSVAKVAPEFARAYPTPVQPDEIKADIFIVTHDHMDHLDPETIGPYAHKATTTFVAPRHAAKHLLKLGVPIQNITVIDQGDSKTVRGVVIEGVFALTTAVDTLDTTGYKLTFANGKTVCHTSDTAYCDLLLQAYPQTDVLLTCINGKYGNLSVDQAVKLTHAVKPKYVIPNHYDVMALNSENPESFRHFVKGAEAECVILDVLGKFEW